MKLSNVKNYSTLLAHRRNYNQFETVLPFSNLEEAEQILKNFTRDFQKEGLADIEDAARAVKPDI